MRNPRPAGWLERCRELLVTVLAALGLASIVAVVAALTLNLSLVVFKTGSMGPTIPAGAVALVRTVPAAELAVGDVVTVDQPRYALPVTHRIVDITAGATASERILTLRGDANPAPDPVTYPVGTAKRVIWAAAGLGVGITWLRQPWILAGLTVLVAGLITWTFWPTDGSRRASCGHASAPTPGDGN